MKQISIYMQNIKLHNSHLPFKFLMSLKFFNVIISRLLNGECI